MLSIPASVKIYLALDFCDMRKGYGGLYSIVQEQLKSDPKSGNLFLFTNKRRNRLKILYCDQTGVWLLSKRLDKGQFSWPVGLNGNNGKLNLSARAMALLLEGVDLKDGMKKAWYEA